MSEHELLKAKVTAIEDGLKALAARLTEINTAYEEMLPEAKAQLSIDPKNLGQLPWTPFKNKNGAWTFSDKAPDLKSALLGCSSVEIGAFRYKLSGDENKFLVRFPK